MTLDQRLKIMCMASGALLVLAGGCGKSDEEIIVDLERSVEEQRQM